MIRRLMIAPLLLALALALSGCSLKSLLPSTTLVGSTPTPAPTVPPTVPPVDMSHVDSYDNSAGNCVDAANEAIDIMTQAAAGRFGNAYFNMDMRLDLSPSGPSSGCADTAHLARYRQFVVASAQLTVWPLDYTWPSTAYVTRQQWLNDVLNLLFKLYPRAQKSIQVLYNGAPCGGATMGNGSGGSPQINPGCY